MRQLIPALLLLTLLLPAAAAAQSPVTRAQFVAALWTCSGAVPYDANGPFSDVNPNSPGATAVAWAYDLGIVRGTGGTLFVPDRPITREEAAVLLRRYAVHLGRDTFLPSGVAACNDFEGISPWADDSLYWAAGIGLLAWGADGRPEPQGTLSPEELEQALEPYGSRHFYATGRLVPHHLLQLLPGGPQLLNVSPGGKAILHEGPGDVPVDIPYVQMAGQNIFQDGPH